MIPRLIAAASSRLALGLVVAGTIATGDSADAQERVADSAYLEAVLVQLESGDIPLPQLVAISEATRSEELGLLLQELSRLRAETRALRTRYTDDYPELRNRLSSTARLESEGVPQVVGLLFRSTVASEELRALQDRYTEEYPPIQNLLREIETIETVSIPAVVEGFIGTP